MHTGNTYAYGRAFTNMSVETDESRRATTMSVHRDTRDRLESLKPYDSMPFNDLLVDMADEYEEDA